MKRVMLAAAFVVAIGGFAAAQTSSAKSATKKQTTGTKTSVLKAKNSKGTVLKQEDSADAKSDSTFKLLLPVQKFELDSTTIPVVKKVEGF